MIVQTAEGHKHLIAGSIADESLLAWSINEKIEYSLPFYCQSKRLTVIGIPIPRATISTLAIKRAEKCNHIYNLLKNHIKTGPVINADETQLQVLKEPGRSAREKSWMWVFLGGEAAKKSVVFQYETGRSGKVVCDFLNDYEGWLQTDDYEAYHTDLRKLCAEGNKSIRHVLCRAHVRRRFYNYWEISKSPDAKRILDLIHDLFEFGKTTCGVFDKGVFETMKEQGWP
ncbi:MAG: IS66 family transposase [Spirochaetales bacterium]|nr:IS66 family transposase [Spirochaetales bacterium]